MEITRLAQFFCRIALVSSVVCSLSQAQKLTTLPSFSGPDGASPSGTPSWKNLFYAPSGKTAAGRLVLQTPTAMFFVISLSIGGQDYAAGVLKVDPSTGGVTDEWDSGAVPESIAAIYVDPNDANYLITVGTNGGSHVHPERNGIEVKRFPVNGSLTPVSVVHYQSNGKRTEAHGGQYSLGRTFVAVNTDDTVCDPPDVCSYDMVVVFDSTYAYAYDFEAGNITDNGQHGAVKVGDTTKVLSLGISPDGNLVLVSGNGYKTGNPAPTAAWTEFFHRAGGFFWQGPNFSRDMNRMSIYDAFGNDYHASTLYESPTENDMCVASWVSAKWWPCWNGDLSSANTASNGLFPIPTSGVTVVGTCANAGCAWSLRPDGTTIKRRRYASVPEGNVCSWNSGAMNANGDVFFVGVGGAACDKAILAKDPGGMQFVPVTPCRVVDTRNPPGIFGGPYISGNSPRDFPIPQGACNIPSTANAYSLNATVIPHGPLGYITVWPTGFVRPLVSTMNSYDGRVKANAVVMPAGTSGGVSVYASDATDVVLDINGYFQLPNDSTLSFFPVTPCRVVDTRNPIGPLGGPYISGKTSRDFPILSSNCGLTRGGNDSALAYSMNFTAVPHGPLGFLTVWPSDQQQPYVSTLNAYSGGAVANAAIVPAANNGDISVYVSDDSDLVIDVNGYFVLEGPNPLSLYTVTPCRVLDTRDGAGAFSGELTVNVKGSPCSVPTAAQAYIFNATIVPGGPLGYLSLWANSQQQPYVSSLNAYDGAVTSNMAIVPTVNGLIDAFASDPTNLLLDITSYFAP